MKKLMALVLALTMIFAVAVSVAADVSPERDSYYYITVTVDGDGKASALPYRVEKNSDGTFTLTIDDEGSGFVKWIISGDYEIVSGSLTSPVLVIKPVSDIDAIAVFVGGENDEEYLYMTTKVVGEGKAEASPAKILKDNDEIVTFTATETGQKFVKWELHCEYDIVSGDMNSKVLVVKPYTDIEAVAYFENGEEETKPVDDKKDDGNKGTKSPNTGAMPYMAVMMLVLAMGAGVVATKKIRG